MSNQDYTCNVCRRRIPESERISHELNCRPSNTHINNYISRDNSSINNPQNINIISQTNSGFNTLYINTMNFNPSATQNEELLSDGTLTNVRNIESNYISDELINYTNAQENSSILGNTVSFPNMINVNSNNPVDTEIVNNLIVNKQCEEKNSNKRECAICLDNINNGDTFIILPCIHFFHDICIKNWMNERNTCPICKFKLTNTNINNMNNINNIK